MKPLALSGMATISFVGSPETLMRPEEFSHVSIMSMFLKLLREKVSIFFSLIMNILIRKVLVFLHLNVFNVTDENDLSDDLAGVIVPDDDFVRTEFRIATAAD